jgi:Tol biopolymer transport system component
LYDRSGKVLDAIGGSARIGHGVFSPDGQTVAFDRADPQKPFASDIWLRDMLRGVESRLTTNGGFNSWPVWSPDGHFVLFNSGHPESESVNNRPTPFRQSVDGASREETFEAAGTGVVTDWSRDGQHLLQNRQGERRDRDIWVVPLVAGHKPYPYLTTPFNEFDARLSPDGRWVAYVSDETSQNEIYVDSFPMRSRKRQVSIRGADRPVWSRGGKELFFIGADQTLMSAEVQDQGDGLHIGVPQTLFPVRVAMGLRSERSWFDVSDDGRFLIPTLIDRTTTLPLTVVVNWPALIRK